MVVVVCAWGGKREIKEENIEEWGDKNILNFKISNEVFLCVCVLFVGPN